MLGKISWYFSNMKKKKCWRREWKEVCFRLTYQWISMTKYEQSFYLYYIWTILDHPGSFQFSLGTSFLLMGNNKKSAVSAIWWGIVSAFCNHNYYKQALKRTFLFLIEQNTKQTQKIHEFTILYIVWPSISITFGELIFLVQIQDHMALSLHTSFL